MGVRGGSSWGVEPRRAAPAELEEPRCLRVGERAANRRVGHAFFGKGRSGRSAMPHCQIVASFSALTPGTSRNREPIACRSLTDGSDSDGQPADSG